LEALYKEKASPDDARSLSSGLMKGYEGTDQLMEHYRQRLGWGLYQYYARHYRLMTVEEE
jgi:hypothetical protein